LSTGENQDIFVAGLLHNIGKIAFSDDLLIMPVNAMNAENLGVYRKYPIRGEQLLMPLEDLRETAKIIRSQQERFDGEGYPDHLSGFNIPTGARILALAGDYFNLQIGTVLQRKLRPEEAYAVIMQNSGKRYDPLVAKAFDELLQGVAPSSRDDDPGKNGGVVVQEKMVGTADLRPGMVISRDLIAREGTMLLSAEHIIDEKMIRQLRDFESAATGPKLSICIRHERSAP